MKIPNDVVISSSAETVLGNPNYLKIILDDRELLIFKGIVTLDPAATEVIAANPECLELILAHPKATAAMKGTPISVRAIVGNPKCLKAILEAECFEGILRDFPEAAVAVVNRECLELILKEYSFGSLLFYIVENSEAARQIACNQEYLKILSKRDEASFPCILRHIALSDPEAAENILKDKDCLKKLKNWSGRPDVLWEIAITHGVAEREKKPWLDTLCKEQGVSEIFNGVEAVSKNKELFKYTFSSLGGLVILDKILKRYNTEGTLEENVRAIFHSAKDLEYFQFKRVILKIATYPDGFKALLNMAAFIEIMLSDQRFMVDIIAANPENVQIALDNTEYMSALSVSALSGNGDVIEKIPENVDLTDTNSEKFSAALICKKEGPAAIKAIFENHERLEEYLDWCAERIDSFSEMITNPDNAEAFLSHLNKLLDHLEGISLIEEIKEVHPRTVFNALNSHIEENPNCQKVAELKSILCEIEQKPITYLVEHERNAQLSRSLNEERAISCLEINQRVQDFLFPTTLSQYQEVLNILADDKQCASLQQRIMRHRVRRQRQLPRMNPESITLKDVPSLLDKMAALDLYPESFQDTKFRASLLEQIQDVHQREDVSKLLLPNENTPIAHLVRLAGLIKSNSTRRRVEAVACLIENLHEIQTLSLEEFGKRAELTQLLCKHIRVIANFPPLLTILKAALPDSKVMFKLYGQERKNHNQRLAGRVSQLFGCAKNKSGVTEKLVNEGTDTFSEGERSLAKEGVLGKITSTVYS